MIFGMSVSTFTTLHMVLSLAGLVAGVLVLLRPSASTKASSLNALFLATTGAACVTGLLFMVEFPRFGLGHTLGILSLVVIVPTALALYRHRLAGPWCGIFVAGVTVALYLNAFIGVMQAFAKIGFLSDLPMSAFASPLLLAHLLVLAICLWLGMHAFTSLQPGNAKPRRARPRPPRVVDRWG